MDSQTAKEFKNFRELVYRELWKQADENLQTEQDLLQTRADFVEAVVDEYNAMMEV